MALNPLDHARLQEALVLAEGSIGLSDPNPRVGCVIGRADGSVLGRGFTQQAGGPHAEIVALREARASGADVQGATAWVTLEPCAHHGRTPPCCDALIEARVGRVVVAVGDPFPQVSGQGMARLRAAGIEVDLADGEVAHAARELNIGFFSRMERGRAWVRMKIAASLDGRTALPNGVSQWITGDAARADGHAWRRRAGAVLTGIGTVLADDPRLDVRLLPTSIQPARAIVDSRLRTPLQARVLAPPGAALIYTSSDDSPQAQALRARGAQVLPRPGNQGQVDLHAVLADLAERAVNEIHVEAGPALNGALLLAGQVDELLLYMAPRLLGAGRPIAALPSWDRLIDSLDYCFVESVAVGTDLRLRLRPRRATG